MQESKIVVIDADSLLYIIGWRSKDLSINEEMIVIADLSEYLTSVLYQVGVTRYIGVFSPKQTFRNQLAVSRPYKGNRPESPEWLQLWKPVIVDHCIKEFGFCIADNIEADDVLSILRGPDVILASPDKDLKQIPGNHYDYTKNIYSTVDEQTAERTLWKQVLMGDSGDNIPGLPRCGKVGAEKILNTAEAIGQPFEAAVWNAYLSAGRSTEYFEEQLNLVKLLDPTPERIEHYSKFIQTAITE